MLKKRVFFILMLVWNVLFFFLCNYWQRMDVEMDLGVGLTAGIIAVIVIALGEASVVQQFYLSAKWKSYQKRVFENRLIKQIFLLVVFHVVALLIVNNLINIHGVFYVAAIGIGTNEVWIEMLRLISSLS